MAPITATHDYLRRLESLAESAQVLQKHGFITQQLSEEELLLKRRCSGCNKGSALNVAYRVT
jgi:RNA exonuclease 1